MLTQWGRLSFVTINHWITRGLNIRLRSFNSFHFPKNCIIFIQWACHIRRTHSIIVLQLHTLLSSGRQSTRRVVQLVTMTTKRDGMKRHMVLIDTRWHLVISVTDMQGAQEQVRARPQRVTIHTRYGRVRSYAFYVLSVFKNFLDNPLYIIRHYRLIILIKTCRKEFY